MRRSFSLLKTASFMLLIDPLFYISSIITILFCSFRFFFAQKFFVSGIGTTGFVPISSLCFDCDGPASRVSPSPDYFRRFRSVLSDKEIQFGSAFFFFCVRSSASFPDFGACLRFVFRRRGRRAGRIRLFGCAPLRIVRLVARHFSFCRD